MAPLSVSPTFFFTLSLLLSASLIPSTPAEQTESSFAGTLDRKLHGFRREKLSHFRFFWHDVIGGKNRTAVQIIPPGFNASSQTGFGFVRMIDDPLTARPDPNSELWGRAQGFYAAASQEDLSLLMAMNFVFTGGKYNGSTVTVFGRNPVGEKEREMPVIGGSGVFRFARGYVKARTVKFDALVAVVEYNVYVLHY